MKKTHQISARVSDEVFKDLGKYGKALDLGNNDGKSVLVSIGASIVHQILKQVEQDLKQLGKGISEFHKIKERWLFKPAVLPFMEVIKNKNIINNLPEEVFFMIMKIQKRD